MHGGRFLSLVTDHLGERILSHLPGWGNSTADLLNTNALVVARRGAAKPDEMVGVLTFFLSRSMHLVEGIRAVIVRTNVDHPTSYNR